MCTADPDETALLSAELTRTRHDYNRLLAQENERDRRRRAAERAAVARRIETESGFHVKAATQRALLPLTGLVYRVENLPDRPSAVLVRELRVAAVDASVALSADGEHLEGARLVVELQGGGDPAAWFRDDSGPRAARRARRSGWG